ncbi:MAG: hypothetical protein AAGF26_01360 [Cyanobacteria bacterium P01_G01_bin.49]
MYPRAEIDNYCAISHDVTIGEGGRGSDKDCLKQGARVYIAPSARFSGAIKIGNDVAIGVNSVVNKNLPDNSVVIGIPAKVVNYKGSSNFIPLS